MSILVVGSLHLDVVMTAPHLPVLDETVTGQGVDYVFGGKGGNQALAAARMGANVALAGRAGTDSFGDMIRATMAASQVNTEQLQHDVGPSGMSAAIVTESGEYGAVIVSAANLNIDVDQIIVPKETTLLLLQNEIPESANVAMARKAKKAGAKVWLNAAPARALSNELVELIDLLIVNRVEAAFYAGMPLLVDVLTTLGADGVIYQGTSYGAHQVDVLSTHGAGDVFVGSLAAQAAQSGNVTTAIPFAQAAAALQVSSDPKERSHLSSQAVTSFMASHGNR